MRLDLTSAIDPALAALVAESRAFYARRPAGRGPSNHDELIAMRANRPAPSECHPMPTVESVRVGGRTANARIHAPTEGPAAGVVLEIHAGGFYLGSAAASDVQNRRLVDELGVAVVSVDYRLAPECPWPAAPDDCETVALWLVENAEARFGTTRLAMSGLSAGSTLAAVTALRLRDRGVNDFGGIVLQCGTYDLSVHTPAGRLISDEYFLDAYAGDAVDRTHPELSPIFADLTGLPEMLIVIGADDILLEDNLAMAARLVAAGVGVDLQIYPASPHAFTAHGTSMARAAVSAIDEWLIARITTHDGM